MFKFQLGEEVKDKVTGFVGVIMGRYEYATGCIQYGLLSRKLKKDGIPQNWVQIDEIWLISTGKKVRITKDDSGPAPAVLEVN